jgi:peptidoglycan-associated lipoprotein
MKRNLIIATLVVFACSSVFLLSSCAKKKLVAEEKEITAPLKEAAKVEEEKRPTPAVEVAKEVKKEEEKAIEKAEEVRIEKLKELEVAKEKVAEEKAVEEKVAEEKVAEEKAVEEKVAEEKVAEEKAVEEKVAEEKAVEEKVAEEKVAEEKAVEEKVAEDRRGIRFEAEPIYFDFDKSFVRPEYRPILREKAEFLKDNPNVHVRVEGNCDERGTNEYNLALGERRAESAKSFLISLGISPDRIETISYGEERPLAVGHNEESWTQNRRDDFVIMKR